jgi:hypothetical protein
VIATLVPADPPGTAPPSAGSRGGRSRARLTVRSGGSVALSMAPLPVAAGHRFSLTIAVATPPGQAETTGSTQEFLLQISG